MTRADIKALVDTLVDHPESTIDGVIVARLLAGILITMQDIADRSIRVVAR